MKRRDSLRLALQASIFVIGFMIAICAKSQAKRQSSDADFAPAVALRLTLKVTGRSACTDNRGINMLYVDLLFTYTNTGDKQVILLRDRTFSSVIDLALTRDDLKAKKFKMDANQDTFSADKLFPRAILGDIPEQPDDRFVILKPSETYQTHGPVGIAVWADLHARQPGGTVAPGDYWMQLILNTWPLSEEEANRTSAQWQKYGMLYPWGIASEPLLVNVPNMTKLPSCWQD
jgi:hypothetical protein